MKLRASSFGLLVGATLVACAADTETTETARAQDTVGNESRLEVESEGGAFEMAYQVIDGQAIAEGDVVLSFDPSVDSASLIGRRWPSATVPYVVESDLPDTTRVTDAIAHWQANTNVRLVPRTSQGDYVSFHPSTGCSSNIGKSGGKQTINLATGETPSNVVGVAIDRSSGRVYYFYKRGFATAGTTARVDATLPHFKYALPAGKVPTDVVEVAFSNAGHLFAWYLDGTVSEGTVTDFVKYAAPAPYALAAGKAPADVAAFAISKTDQTHVFYKDGTYGVGTPKLLTATPAPFAVAAGKTFTQLAHVDVTSSGAFYAFYTDGKTSSGIAANLASATALAPVAYPGHCAVGQTIHEIGHAIGLFHEQTRQDRDSYVTINFANIQSGTSGNFQKYSSSTGVDVGPYDYDSVMHYGSYSFSSNGQPTLLKLDGTTVAGQRNGLSPGDIASVKRMYPTAP